MNIRSRLLLMLLLMSISVLVACSSDEAEDPTDVPTEVSQVDPTEEPTEEPTDVPTDEPTDVPTDAATETTDTGDDPSTDTTEFECPEGEAEIVVAAGAVGVELQLAQEAGERFQELCPNITVTPLESPDLATDRLGLYIQFLGSESPLVDVYQVDIVNVGGLAEHFLDLTEVVGGNFVDTQFPSMIQTGTVDGQLVALPWLIDTGHLYYRTDLLEKYELEVPTTWEALEEAARIIQDGERSEGNSEFWGYVWQGAIGEGLTCNALEWQASHDGGVIITPDGDIDVNNPEFITALERARGWIGEISPEGVIGQAEEDARAIWQAGNAAFMRNWFYAYSLGNGDDSPIKGLFATTRLPAGPSGQSAATLGGQSLAVSRYSDNLDAAVAVALFMASEQEQKIRSLQASMNPTFPSLYEDSEILDAYPFYADILDVFLNTATPRPSAIAGDDYGDASSLYFTAVFDVLRGDSDAQSAIEYLEIDLEDLLAGN